MFIKNLTNGVIQACHNVDAIRSIKKDPEHYAVAETAEELAGVKSPAKASNKPESEPEKTEAWENAPEDVEGNSEAPESDTEGEPEKEYSEEELEGLKVTDLRDIAKAKGIQGFKNMDKATLAQVILAH